MQMEEWGVEKGRGQGRRAGDRRAAQACAARPAPPGAPRAGGRPRRRRAPARLRGAAAARRRGGARRGSLVARVEQRQHVREDGRVLASRRGDRDALAAREQAVGRDCVVHLVLQRLVEAGSAELQERGRVCVEARGA